MREETRVSGIETRHGPTVPEGAPRGVRGSKHVRGEAIVTVVMCVWYLERKKKRRMECREEQRLWTGQVALGREKM